MKFHIIRECEDNVCRPTTDTFVVSGSEAEVFDTLIGMADEDIENDIRAGIPVTDVCVYRRMVAYSACLNDIRMERRTYEMFEI